MSKTEWFQMKTKTETNENPKIKGLAENLPKKIEESRVYLEKHFN